MSELSSQPPFAIAAHDVSRLHSNIAELGLTGRPHLIVGATALQLYDKDIALTPGHLV
jgi:hypothetical protein